MFLRYCVHHTSVDRILCFNRVVMNWWRNLRIVLKYVSGDFFFYFQTLERQIFADQFKCFPCERMQILLQRKTDQWQTVLLHLWNLLLQLTVKMEEENRWYTSVIEKKKRPQKFTTFLINSLKSMGEGAPHTLFSNSKLFSGSRHRRSGSDKVWGSKGCTMLFW